MKKVARITIGTERGRYVLVVPNVDYAAAKKLTTDARRAARVERELGNTSVVLLFEFENENLQINEIPDFIHIFIKEEAYNFDTPTIYPNNR